MEDDNNQPLGPQHLERWNENLAQHVEKFSTVIDETEPRFDTIENILQTVAQWYVRKDGKYYDVEEPGPVFSRDDIERIIIQRLKAAFPGSDLSKDLIRQMLHVLVKDLFVDPRRSIPIWSGLRQSMPGCPDKLTFKRMAATINTWKEPGYRQLGHVKPNWGLFERYMQTTFQVEAERKMLLNWLAWCLQNESDKPGWAPFLFSADKGTGKSTFAKVAGMLFGEANTATENNINKLVSRFNAPILEKKLVVCEELYLPPGSDKANAIKTFITEKETVAEHKYQSAQQVEQVCSFIFITNHKPIWLEEGDRRFYVIEVKHDGHRLGPRGSEYAQEVGELINSLADPNQLAALYQALIKHPMPDSFDPHSLDVLEHSTNIMTELRESSFDINRVSVEEYLNRKEIIAITSDGMKNLISDGYSSKLTALKHVLADLGWVCRKTIKWGGYNYARVIYLRPGYTIAGKTITGPDGWTTDTTSPINQSEASYSPTREGFTRPDLFDPEETDFDLDF